MTKTKNKFNIWRAIIITMIMLIICAFGYQQWTLEKLKKQNVEYNKIFLSFSNWSKNVEQIICTETPQYCGGQPKVPEIPPVNNATTTQ